MDNGDYIEVIDYIIIYISRPIWNLFEIYWWETFFDYATGMPTEQIRCVNLRDLLSKLLLSLLLLSRTLDVTLI